MDTTHSSTSILSSIDVRYAGKRGMSRSGRQYRDPFNLQARRRKAGPIGSTRRQREIELLERELDEEVEDYQYEEHEDERDSLL